MAALMFVMFLISQSVSRDENIDVHYNYICFLDTHT